MTNFGGRIAYDAGRNRAARGVMGNAQTHCVQLPNLFAFARGAAGLPPAEVDYVEFAEDLIPGYGLIVAEAWAALEGTDQSAMESFAARLSSPRSDAPSAGKPGGLTFNDPTRFMNDLAMMLRQRAARQGLIEAIAEERDSSGRLRKFLTAAEAWQGRHGYQGEWDDRELHDALRRLNSPPIRGPRSHHSDRYGGRSRRFGRPFGPGDSGVSGTRGADGRTPRCDQVEPRRVGRLAGLEKQRGARSALV